ncbi:MAG: bifunctional hydroxymethylpyrimidine kinase/phosphomethylpyrimidine kinase [Pontibacterium sp.]
MPIPIALTIAGSDSGSGAGIQADLKTFAALGVYGTSVITALTAQNTHEVRAVHPVPVPFILQQLETVFDDLAISTVKTGMLGGADVVEAIADFLEQQPGIKLVVDPVMLSKSGRALLKAGAVNALVDKLLPLTTLITPNLPEAAVLLGCEEPDDLAGMIKIARDLKALGPERVLLKGGHLASNQSPDVFFDGVQCLTLNTARINTKNTHGTGCTLASAVAALLARGETPVAAVKQAKAYISGAIIGADSLDVGSGHGPLHHFHALWPQ